MSINYLELAPGEWVDFAEPEEKPLWHQFDADSIGAVNAALASGRALLVRGETGLGKTQLAEAAAAVLKRAFLPVSVDSRTDHRDLMWTFDAVRRLAKAQLAAKNTLPSLAERDFVRPGPLWWAINWETAQRRLNDSKANLADCDDPLDRGQNATRKENGWVLLLDEIDKAEPELANGLLESLGAMRFTPYGDSTPVTPKGPLPLVVITTNEERSLPAAFVRRCVVLQLRMPDEANLQEFLAQRGERHFKGLVSKRVLDTAARQLADDRRRARDADFRPLPGQAEYLDLIRVVAARHPKQEEKQLALLAEAAKFFFKKRAE